MQGPKRTDALETVYGAVAGGLLSAFIAMSVVDIFLATDSTMSASSMMSLYAAIAGLACALALMVGGMMAAERFSWLGTALLFASGFTALWSIALSFSMEQRWASLLALGVATVLGIGLGWWRFGRVKKEPAASVAGDAPVLLEAGDVDE
jgi:hypothetical protein